jgi:hypothetical protein
MNGVELKLFGDLRIVSGDAVLHRLPSVPCRRLLASLAIHAGRPVRKRQLEEAIWPGPRPPSNRLAVTLYQLKRGLDQLGSADPTLFESSRTHLRLAIDPARVDLHRFIARCEAARSSQKLEDGLAALAEYPEPVLDHWDEPWAVEAREEARLRASKICSLLVRQARTREDVNRVTQALVKAMDGDRVLSAGVIESIRAIEGMGGALVASILSEQLVIYANPKTEASLRPLSDRAVVSFPHSGESPSFWCIVMLDHAPNREAQFALSMPGSKIGRTPDYWMASSPDTAAEIARRALYEKPESRILLTLAYMSQEEALPLGFRGLRSGIPSRGIWVDLRAARGYEAPARQIGPPVDGVLAPLLASEPKEPQARRF